MFRFVCRLNSRCEYFLFVKKLARSSDVIETVRYYMAVWEPRYLNVQKHLSLFICDNTKAKLISASGYRRKIYSPWIKRPGVIFPDIIV